LGLLFWWARIFLTVGLGLYLLVMVLAAIPYAIKRKDGQLMAGIPLAILTMHFCWGFGFLFSILRTKS